MRTGQTRRAAGARKPQPAQRIRRPAPTDDDERSPDERTWPIRWGRVYVALGMIAVAILWLALDNRFGVVTQPAAPTPTAPMSKPLAALGTAQDVGTAMVNAKLVATTTAIGALHAPLGERYLVLGVEVINQGHAALAVPPTAFSVQANGLLRAAIAYPGHHDGLFARPVPPGGRAQGVIVGTERLGTGPAILLYTGPGNTHADAGWSIP